MKSRFDIFHFSLFVFMFMVLGTAGLSNIQNLSFAASNQAAAVSLTGLVPCGVTDLNGDGMIKDVGNVVEECHFSDFIVLISKLTNFLIILGTSIAALAFAYAGFLMFTASGEMGKVEEAKSIFGKVMVGFLFMLSAWLIVHAIEAAFLDTTKFKSLLE